VPGPKVFVARIIPDEGLRPILDACEAEVWQDELPPPRDALLSAIEGCDGVLSLLTDKVDAEFLDRAGPNLKVVSNFAVGFDNIDVAACTRRGIPTGNTPGVLTETTADLAFALILACARRVVDGADAVRAGEWQTWEPAGWLGHDAHGAVLGIVGAGEIGSAVARRASGFDMEVLLNGREPGPGRVPLDELLGRSDFVSLHAPLTEETHHMIGEGELRAMRHTAILVNTGRGELVDPAALRRALEEGWIAGAGLDVTEPEPLPADDPLLGAPNLTVLPHVGSASHATREAMASLAVDNLLAALAGEAMPNPVEPD
jgi:glyoxylate reductase